jgi:hypothetical protein
VGIELAHVAINNPPFGIVWKQLWIDLFWHSSVL